MGIIDRDGIDGNILYKRFPGGLHKVSRRDKRDITGDNIGGRGWFPPIGPPPLYDRCRSYE